MSDAPQPVPPTPDRLGEILQDARTRQGLELSDIARSTHVRKDYLQALEEGRYQDLPEDVYSKNFLRLYARELGLDDAEMVERFHREKPAAPQNEDAPLAPATRYREQRRPAGSASRFGGWFATLLLVVVLVAAAVWGFNSLLFHPSRMAVSASEQEPVTAPPTPDTPDRPAPHTTDPAEETAADASGTVLLSVTSIPPGAEVSVDNYTLPGTTPVTNMPVTAGKGRILRVSLPGYQPYEHAFDMSFDRNLSVALNPIPAAAPEAATSDIPEPAQAPVAQDDQIALRIEEASWLEVYEGTSRGQGKTLLYRTVQPGETFTFDLPVYLHVGNAGGVRYSLDGQDKGLLGSSGEVVSLSFE
ncbi:MAG TPA: RodZ domain-containing protein [Trueperaceae bacterium]